MHEMCEEGFYSSFVVPFFWSAVDSSDADDEGSSSEAEEAAIKDSSSEAEGSAIKDYSSETEAPAIKESSSEAEEAAIKDSSSQAEEPAVDLYAEGPSSKKAAADLSDELSSSEESAVELFDEGGSSSEESNNNPSRQHPTASQTPPLDFPASPAPHEAVFDEGFNMEGYDRQSDSITSWYATEKEVRSSPFNVLD